MRISDQGIVWIYFIVDSQRVPLPGFDNLFVSIGFPEFFALVFSQCYPPHNKLPEMN